MPELIPLFLIFHFEPIVYPVFFFGFKTWDRFMGREPWDPDRSATSSMRRTTMKVSAYQASILFGVVGLFVILNQPVVYAVLLILLMGVFNFVHERIWCDQNYGITEDDMVEPKRVIAKSLTYRLVGVLMTGGLLHALMDPFPWAWFIACQSTLHVIYLSLEFMWSGSAYGIRPTETA